MDFKKYQHIERFGTTDVEGIEFGECYVFPKIDGTNASVWINDDGEFCAGSRSRELSLDADNAGFLAWALENTKLFQYLLANPTHRLYGEWLVPHSLKTYRGDAWRDFYVFDVCEDLPEDKIPHESADAVRYIPYKEYSVELEKYGINYIPPLKIVKNGSYEAFVKVMESNNYLVEDGKGKGEGVVIKRYDFLNKYGRNTFAKIITSEFKEKHHKEMGAPEMEGKKMIEADIVDEYVTKAFVDKEFAKIEAVSGFSSKQIPQLLGVVYHELVSEESWNFVKKYKYPTINFKTLQHFTISKVKSLKPELF